jgi:hypothetical protein
MAADGQEERPAFVLHEHEDADKSIADLGWWEEHDRNERRLIFTLHGRGEPRRYALIRTSDNWLLHRTKEQP